jgi:hypothetical protein
MTITVHQYRTTRNELTTRLESICYGIAASILSIVVFVAIVGA